LLIIVKASRGKHIRRVQSYSYMEGVLIVSHSMAD
jgi:hypothetical protein